MIDIKKIQADFPILNTLIHGNSLVYLDNAATTQKPQIVIDSLSDFYSSTNSNIHRGVHNLSMQSSYEYEKSRDIVQSFINAKSRKEIIFTSGTTESINLIANTLGKSELNNGDEILISEMEHHSNILPWQMLRDEKGIKLQVIPMDQYGNLDFESFKKLITTKTRIVSITYVSNVVGTVNPVKRFIDYAHKLNIPVLIDGAQAIAHMPIDVQELNCDFFAFSGHKVYAETGIGVLYGKEHILDKLPTYKQGGGMIKSVTFNKSEISDLPQKFEAGTANYVGAVSLGIALNYINKIGLENIKKYEGKLLAYALDKLSKIKGLTVYGNPIDRCGVLSFNLKNLHPYDVGVILDRMGIAVRTGTHCAEPTVNFFGVTGTLRISFSIHNTFEDIDRLIKGLEKAQLLLC